MLLLKNFISYSIPVSRRVYIGLGGNIGNPLNKLHSALEKIKQTDGISRLHCSNFYRTSPVSAIPQDDFVNAVCAFDTTLSLRQLFEELERIETELGKTSKSKDAPRLIDLDILFYGEERYDDGELRVPHPCWNQRLFVLAPLGEVANEIAVKKDKFNIPLLLKHFTNPSNERIEIIQRTMHETSSN